MTPEVKFVREGLGGCRRERAMVASLVDSLLPCFGVAVVDLVSSVVVVIVVDSAAVAGGDGGGGKSVGVVGVVVVGRGVVDDNNVVVGGGTVPVVGTRSSDGGDVGFGVLVALGPPS